MASILETTMMICFGLSWPINLMKAYRARTTKGTSLFFIVLIQLGYTAGIAAKLASDGSKVGGAIAEIKNLDSMKGKNPIALAAAMKEPTSEINVIKGQLADAVKACAYWQDLNKQDEMAQKFMKDYPIEK